MTKRILLIVLAFVMLLSFGACSGKSATESSPNNDSAKGNEAQAVEEKAPQKEEAAAKAEPKEDTEAKAEPKAEDNNEPVLSEAEAVGKTEANKRVVIKYVGSGIGFTTGDGKSNHGAAHQYYVFEGFKDDGALNQIKATARVWYFYDNDESYEKGLADFNDFAIKAKNKASKYFCVGVGFDSDWKSYDDIISAVNNKSVSGMIVTDKEYELVN